jgi:hypothetical protein
MPAREYSLSKQEKRTCVIRQQAGRRAGEEKYEDQSTGELE